MKQLFVIASVAFCIPCLAGDGADSGPTAYRNIPLWQGGQVPGAVADGPLDAPFLTVFTPRAGAANGGAAWDHSGYALRPGVRAVLSGLDADVFDMGCWYRGRRIPYDTVILDPVGHLLTLGHREVATVLWDWMRGDRERLPASCFLALNAPDSP